MRITTRPRCHRALSLGVSAAGSAAWTLEELCTLGTIDSEHWPLHGGGSRTRSAGDTGTKKSRRPGGERHPPSHHRP